MVCPCWMADADFADLLLGQREGEEEQENILVITKLVRKRQLLTTDSEIEISMKEYPNDMNIVKKVSFILLSSC